MIVGVRHHCHACNLTFESDIERCPKCLRLSTVDVRKEEPVETARPAGTRTIRLLVAMVIIVPLETMNLLEWHLGVGFACLVAVAGFCVGFGVEYAVRKSRAQT